MDYTSVLNSLGVYHSNGILKLDVKGKLIAAFLQDGSKVEAVLTKKGDANPVHRQDFYVQKL